MNERIKELIEQATKHYPATETSGEFSTFDKEKFAELLLKECIQVVDATMTENQDMNIGLVMASAAIVSHFEIEE